MFSLTQLIDKIKETFRPATYGERLEQYIISHQPKTPADVEYLIQQFDRGQQRAQYGMFSYR